jgi:FG-GAP-like repeat
VRRTSFGIGSLCVALAFAAGGAAGTSGGDPSFAPGPSLPLGATPVAAAVGDFNGDGSQDLAVANAGYRNNLRILLNDGSAHFLPAEGSPLKVGKFPSSVAKADFNGDGKTDLAVASENVRILLGDGTGKFSAAPGSPVALDGVPLKVIPADLTGDGRPDLVADTYREDTDVSGVAVLLNDGSGHFMPGPLLSVGGHGEIDVAVADYTGDGKQDLVVSASNSRTLSILPGNGAGGFGSSILVSVGKAPGALGVADFNGDGKPDLAVFVRAGLAIVLGDGAGGLHPAAGSPLSTPAYANQLAIADLNGDTKPDLAVADPDVGTLHVLLGNGSGGFREAALSPFFARWPNAVVAADFDSDGKTELLPLSYDISWGPYPPGNWLLRQAPSAPAIAAGRSLPARADAVLSTRWQISDLAADGNQVAICSSGIHVWTAARTTRRINGDCQRELAVGGGRVAWIENYFGNTHRGYIVYVAKVSGGRPRAVESTLGDDIETEGGDDVGGPWVGQILGGGPLLAYNSWWVDCVPPPCDEECRDEGGGGGCDTYNPTLRLTSQGLTRIGVRHLVYVGAGPGSYPLRAVGGGRMAVGPSSGVVVLGPKGGRISSVPAVRDDPVRSVALSRTQLALLHSFSLDLYAPATGKRQRSFALGPAAGLDLAGVNARLALLRGHGHLVLVRLRDGKLLSFPLRPAAAKGLVDAQLTGAGLFYAYNVAKGATKGRVVFEPVAKLLARF